MKCPTCGKAELERKEDDKEWKGIVVPMKWQECPKCGEKLYHIKEIRRVEKIAARTKGTNG